MVKSWNAFARDESVTRKEFRWTGVGRLAEDFPTVHGARL